MTTYASPWNKPSQNRFKDAWELAKDADPTHPYLVRKKVQAHSIRQSGDNLVIAIYGDGENIAGIQTIDGAGEKKFMGGSVIDGGFYALNTHLQYASKIYVAEGFATSASIAEQTGCLTVCARRNPKTNVLSTINYPSADITLITVVLVVIQITA